LDKQVIYLYWLL